MRIALFILLGLAVGGAAGAYGGWRQGSASVLNECLYADARQVQTSVAALKLLRAGERPLALEALEAGVDDTIVTFDAPYPGIETRTNAELGRALAEVKTYRSANPRKSSRAHVDQMVGHLLSRQK
ncbi:MAG TPA: hypothetical protein VJQ58_03270 [Burkholderiales bacterium]|nr:hypothetical protein [Burkholderiales bacterium]